jgi:hypothetical protein
MLAVLLVALLLIIIGAVAIQSVGLPRWVTVVWVLLVVLGAVGSGRI